MSARRGQVNSAVMGKQQGGPLFSFYLIWVKPGRLLHFRHAQGYLCGKTRMVSGISTYCTQYACRSVCLCVWESNTSYGRLMIGLIDTQQWIQAFVSSRDALWKAYGVAFDSSFIRSSTDKTPDTQKKQLLSGSYSVARLVAIKHIHPRLVHSTPKQVKVRPTAWKLISLKQKTGIYISQNAPNRCA